MKLLRKLALSTFLTLTPFSWAADYGLLAANRSLLSVRCGNNKGSGVVINLDYRFHQNIHHKNHRKVILTNNHVTQNHRKARLATVAKFNNDHARFQGTVTARSPSWDIALISSSDPILQQIPGAVLAQTNPTAQTPIVLAGTSRYPWHTQFGRVLSYRYFPESYSSMPKTGGFLVASTQPIGGDSGGGIYNRQTGELVGILHSSPQYERATLATKATHIQNLINYTLKSETSLPGQSNWERGATKQKIDELQQQLHQSFNYPPQILPGST